MEIIKQSIVCLNSGQTPVDVCDQPVFGLTKQIHWRCPEKFRSGSYFSLFGGLHFEQYMLTTHGELIKGSGIENISSNTDMSNIGTGAQVHASNIKQARYCLQVPLCALFLKLNDAVDKLGSMLSSFEWLEQSKH